MLLQPAHVGLACWRASVVLAVEQFAQGFALGCLQGGEMRLTRRSRKCRELKRTGSKGKCQETLKVAGKTRKGSEVQISATEAGPGARWPAQAKAR